MSQLTTPSVAEGLTLLMSDIESEVEKLRVSLANAELSAVARKAFLRALPASLPQAPSGIQVELGSDRTPLLQFKLTNPAEMLPLLEALPGEPLLMVSGGCTSFEPEETFTPSASRAHEKLTPVGPVYYRLSHWVSRLQEEFCWWTRLDGRLVEVRAVTADGGATRARVRGSSQPLGQMTIETSWTYENLPKGEVLHWYGGSRSSVSPVTVHVARGADWREAMAGAQSSRHLVTTAACDC